MRIRNVLIFPAGTEIGLEIFNALKYCKETKLFGAGQDVSNHGKYVYSQYHVLPSIHEAGWLTQLIALCEKLSIHYIFPAYDDVIVALSREQAHIPACIISSPQEACEITRSKSATYARLGKLVRVPQVYLDANEIPAFPVLVKPDKGQGSSGILKVEDPEALNRAIASVPDAIVCEYLPGDEYTVDCFSDRERGVLFAGARERRRTRNGISVNTVTTEIPEALRLAEIIGGALKLRGAWFFQLKRDTHGQLALLEVAPRIAGSMAAHRVKGINFPLLSIFEHERLPIQVQLRPGTVELDRALCNRYRHAVNFGVAYIDLDDTLLCEGQVNVQVVKLIFQCVNQGRPVKLLTRHRGDLALTLAKHRLAGLFDQLIHIAGSERKSGHILESDAILIDDSFSERMEVEAACGIATFDCSMIEMLTGQAEFLNRSRND